MILELVVGYITILKCFTVSMVFICFAPSILRAYRNVNGNGRPRAINTNLVTKIIKQKFNP
jgi:hypothetical protein